jgi:molecular chaperone GrpE (heat shock protein)
MTDDKKRIELLTKWNEQIKEAFNEKSEECEYLHERLWEAEKEAARHAIFKWTTMLNCFMCGLLIGKAIFT